ncbi:MAG: thiol-disulfide oxidoreductase DCC family protein [Rhodovulum sp.]
METSEVIYNGACPVCAREIAGYRRMAEAEGAAVRFTDLNDADLAHLGLSADDAARRLHVVRDGQVIAGFPAFLALWSGIGRTRWLARVLGLPGVRQVAGLGYERIAAPVLYAMHRRRLHKGRAGG